MMGVKIVHLGEHKPMDTNIANIGEYLLANYLSSIRQ
jgi:hypothetical protein